MSYKTNPINNRLGLNKGWKSIDFIENKQEYATLQVNSLRLYLLLKSYLYLKNYILLACNLYSNSKHLTVFLLKKSKRLKVKYRKYIKKYRYRVHKEVIKSPFVRFIKRKKIPLIYNNYKLIKILFPHKFKFNFGNLFLTSNVTNKLVNKYISIKQRSVNSNLIHNNENNYVKLLYKYYLFIISKLFYLQTSIKQLITYFKYISKNKKAKEYKILLKVVYSRLLRERCLFIKTNIILKDLYCIINNILNKIKRKVVLKTLKLNFLFNNNNTKIKNLNILWNGWYLKQKQSLFSIFQISNKINSNLMFLSSLKRLALLWVYKNNINIFQIRQLTRLNILFTKNYIYSTYKNKKLKKGRIKKRAQILMFKGITLRKIRKNKLIGDTLKKKYKLLYNRTFNTKKLKEKKNALRFKTRKYWYKALLKTKVKIFIQFILEEWISYFFGIPLRLTIRNSWNDKSLKLWKYWFDKHSASKKRRKKDLSMTYNYFKYDLIHVKLRPNDIWLLKRKQDILNIQNNELHSGFRNNLVKNLFPVFSLFLSSLDPTIFLEEVAKIFKKTRNYRSIIESLRSSLQLISSSKCLGIRIAIYGKLSGKNRARNEFLDIGRVPVQQFSSRINYSMAQAQSKTGAFGLKIWVFF